MLDFVIGLFTNPLILLLILSPILLFLGIIIGNYVSQPRKNIVMKVSPESHRGVQLDIKDEDAVNVYCDPVGKIPPQRFIKRLSPFNIVRKGWLRLQNFSVWFGRYGTAYVHEFSDESVKVSLINTINNLFGKKYFKQIPKEVMRRIEDSKLGVMIEFPKNPLTPKGEDGKPLRSISEDDLNRDNDERAMRNLWEEYDKEKKRSALNVLMAIGTGVAVGIGISLIMKWGAPIVIENVVPPGL